MRRWIAIIAVFVLVLASCGGTGSGAGSSDVVDFAEIAATEATLAFDPTATSARLNVVTTIRAVCAVAYGETEALGRLSTDQDMEAAGHEDHGPILSGLQPNTTYFYRLQGVGSDGTLYQSELFTFTTPTPQEINAGSNIARNATIAGVSSEFSNAFAAGNAIDGKPATEWSSRGDGDDAFITIDLGSEQAVSAIRFVTREMGDGSSLATTYTVVVDGEVFGPFDAGLDAPLIEVDFTGRVLRFDIESSTGGNTGAAEIEVFAR